MRLSLFILGVFAVIVPPLCSPLVPIKNKIKLTGAEHEKLLCWHWFVVRGRGRRIQEEIKITPNFTVTATNEIQQMAATGVRSGGAT